MILTFGNLTASTLSNEGFNAKELSACGLWVFLIELVGVPVEIGGS